MGERSIYIRLKILAASHLENVLVNETNFQVKYNFKEALEVLPYLIQYEMH